MPRQVLTFLSTKEQAISFKLARVSSPSTLIWSLVKPICIWKLRHFFPLFVSSMLQKDRSHPWIYTGDVTSSKCHLAHWWLPGVYENSTRKYVPTYSFYQKNEQHLSDNYLNLKINIILMYYYNHNIIDI